MSWKMGESRYSRLPEWSKNNKHKTAALLFGHADPDDQSGSEVAGFYLLERIQDEVRRFAITFHRQLHAKNSVASLLEGN